MAYPPNQTELLAAVSASPAILRLRMLELRYDLRGRELTREAQAQAQTAIIDLQTAIVTRPGLSLACVVARLHTLDELARDTAPGEGEAAEWDMTAA